MKSLFNFEHKIWQDEETFPAGRCAAAAGLLLLSIFVVPVAARHFFSDRMELPDILIFSAMPGICAYGWFTASKLPFKMLAVKEMFSLTALALILSVAAGITVWGWKLLLFVLFKFPLDKKQFAVEIIGQYDGMALVKIFFALCIFAPLIEELLFRRIIYGFLLRYGFRFAMVLTAAGFSLCHFFIPGLPGLFLLGLGFQFAALKHRNLAASVWVHSMVNSFAFAAAYFSFRSQGSF